MPASSRLQRGWAHWQGARIHASVPCAASDTARATIVANRAANEPGARIAGGKMHHTIETGGECSATRKFNTRMDKRMMLATSVNYQLMCGGHHTSLASRQSREAEGDSSANDRDTILPESMPTSGRDHTDARVSEKNRRTDTQPSFW